MGVKRFAPLMLLLAAGSVRAQVELLPASMPVAGTSQVDWSRQWWTWAASFELSGSPVADRTGRLCHLKQEGAVWFLAGTYDTHRTIRKCTVPAGKYLFFPLVNYVFFSPPEDARTCADVRKLVSKPMDDVTSLVLEVDGKRLNGLEAHRLATGCFDLYERIGGSTAVSASNGYYVMLKPLTPGTHTLNFGGGGSEMSQAVTYTLNVKN